MSCLRKRLLEAKLSHLQSTPFFVYVEESDLQQLARAFTLHRFVPAQPIPESPFYVLVRGELSIVNKSDKKVLCNKKQGAFFSRRAGLVEVVSSKSGSQSRFSSRLSRASKVDRRSSAKMGDSTDNAPSLRSPASLASSRSSSRFTASKASLAEATTAVIARTEGEVMLLTPVAFTRFMARASEASNLGVRSMMSTNIESMLLRVPFIRDAALAATAVRALGDLCSYTALDAGASVFEQGDDGSEFYMILHGSVDVTIDRKAFEAESPAMAGAASLGMSEAEKQSRPERFKAASIKAGQCFGEMALVIDAKRSASANAAERSLFLAVSKENFRSFIGVAPALEASVNSYTKTRLLERYRALRVPFFADMGEEHIQRASELSSLVHLQPGEIICRQGEPGEAFYVVLDGEVRVRQVPSNKMVAGGINSRRDSDDPGAARGDDLSYSSTGSVGSTSSKAGGGNAFADLTKAKDVDVLRSGRYFGEISVMLPDTMCTATCSAAEASKCTLLALPRAAFQQLFGHDRSLIAELHLKLMRKECALSHVLNHKLARPLFEKKLQAEYADEALQFYDGVAAYAQRPTAELPAAARALVDEFVRKGAPQEVNIPDEQRKEILANLEASCTSTLFARAQKEAYDLMARDTYRRFVREDEFQALLDTLGSYKGKTSLAQVNLTSIKVELV